MNGKFVTSLICVDFSAKLQMAWEAMNKGYEVVFTRQGLDVYETEKQPLTVRS
jgi:hypothetical protein